MIGESKHSKEEILQLVFIKINIHKGECIKDLFPRQISIGTNKRIKMLFEGLFVFDYYRNYFRLVFEFFF